MGKGRTTSGKGSQVRSTEDQILVIVASSLTHSPANVVVIHPIHSLDWEN